MSKAILEIEQRLKDFEANLREKAEFQSKCSQHWVRVCKGYIDEMDSLEEDDYALDFQKDEKREELEKKVLIHIKKMNIELAELDKIEKEIYEFIALKKELKEKLNKKPKK